MFLASLTISALVLRWRTPLAGTATAAAADGPIRDSVLFDMAPFKRPAAPLWLPLFAFLIIARLGIEKWGLRASS